MSSAQRAISAGPAAPDLPRRWPGRVRRPGPETLWAVAFLAPYAGVLVAFAIFPVAYGFWMARSPSLYLQLLGSDEYWESVLSTALFVGIGANASLLLAL